MALIRSYHLQASHNAAQSLWNHTTEANWVTFLLRLFTGTLGDEAKGMYPSLSTTVEVSLLLMMHFKEIIGATGKRWAALKSSSKGQEKGHGMCVDFVVNTIEQKRRDIHNDLVIDSIEQQEKEHA